MADHDYTEPPAWLDGYTGDAEMRQDHDITEAMRTLHDNGVTAADYAEYLAARHRAGQAQDMGDPF